MKYKKHNWNRFNYSNNVTAEIKIFDIGGRTKLDYFKCNNSKDFQKIIKIIKDKYGLG